jgi:hypothetical protein
LAFKKASLLFIIVLLGISVIIPLSSSVKANALSTLTIKPNGQGSHSEYTEISNSGFLFSDQLESNSLAYWTSSSGTPIVQSTTVHTGVYAAEASLSSGSEKYIQKSFVSPYYSTVYFRSYVEVSAMPASGKTLDLMKECIGGTANIIATAQISNVAGVYKWTLNYLNGAAHPTVTYATLNPVVDRWSFVELKGVVSSSVGEARLYVNGTEIITETGLNTGTSNIGNVRLSAWYSSSVTGNVFWDDAEVSTVGPIGEENRPALVNDGSDVTAIKITTSTTLKESFNFDNHVAENQSIQSVSIYGRVKTSGDANDYFVFITNTEGSEVESSSIALSTSFATYSLQYDFNPVTSAR